MRKPVALFTPGALHGEDEGEPELNDLDEEAVLAPGKQLIVDDAGEQVALGADGGEKVVRVKDLLEAIEEAGEDQAARDKGASRHRAHILRDVHHEGGHRPVHRHALGLVSDGGCGRTVFTHF